MSYLQSLKPLLGAEPLVPRILLGDFNQTVPRTSQPVRAFEALTGALAAWHDLATAGVVDGHGRKAIDHLAHTRDLTARILSELPSRTPDGIRLSDHSGLVLEVQRAS